MDTSDFAVRLADKLIAQLKDGTSPWQKPWTDGQVFGPYNPTTGNRYRGVNIIALMATDFGDPRWMTYKQAQSHGWQVKRGEKSTQIQHWTWEEERVRLGQNGQPELDSQGKAIKERVRLGRPKVIGAAVFNAQQIEGVPPLEPKRDSEWNPIEQAEKLLKRLTLELSTQHAGAPFIASRPTRFTYRTRIGSATLKIIIRLHCTNSAIGPGTRTGLTVTLRIPLAQPAMRGRSSGQRSRV
jgi:putative DNA primase/helicase